MLQSQFDVLNGRVSSCCRFAVQVKVMEFWL